jgi:hypothetical protein
MPHGDTLRRRLQSYRRIAVKFINIFVQTRISTSHLELVLACGRSWEFPGAALGTMLEGWFNKSRRHPVRNPARTVLKTVLCVSTLSGFSMVLCSTIPLVPQAPRRFNLKTALPTNANSFCISFHNGRCGVIEERRIQSRLVGPVLSYGFSFIDALSLGLLIPASHLMFVSHHVGFMEPFFVC